MDKYRDHPDIESCEIAGYPADRCGNANALTICVACGEDIFDGDDIVEHDGNTMHDCVDCISTYAREFDAVEYDIDNDCDHDIANMVREEGYLRTISPIKIEPEISVYDRYDYFESTPCDVMKYCEKFIENNI